MCLVPLAAFAQKGVTQTADCYNKSPSSSALLFLNKNKLSVSDQFEVQKDRCTELNPDGVLKEMPKSNTWRGAIKGLEYRAVELVIGNGSSAFDLMQIKGWATPAQNEFKAKINEIKEIPDRNERIEKIYALIHRVQGVAGSSTASGVLMNDVDASTLVERSKQLGGIGVCHEFASLLYYALNQVGRYAHSKGSLGALDPATDFSASMMYGEVPTLEGGMYHQWVRLNLPVKDNQGVLQFKNVDLDTLQYPRFTPLEPRQQGLSASEQKQQFDECMAALRCLGDQSGKTVKPSDVDGDDKDRGAVI